MAVSPLDRRPKRAMGTSLESLLSLTRYSLRAVTLALAPLLVSCTADGPADLVLLSGDPLADITNTRSVEAVISKGVFLSRAQLDGLVR